MSGRSRVIDPKTRDYVSDGKGGRVTTTTVQTSLYHAFQGRRDKWGGDPEHGSDLWRFTRDRLTQDAPARAENAIRVAAQPFLDEGLLRSFEARAERDPDSGRLLIATEAVDATSGPLNVDDIVAFAE
jgi:phage gp46-like protein